jgi:hypothetical protein
MNQQTSGNARSKRQNVEADWAQTYTLSDYQRDRQND